MPPPVEDGNHRLAAAIYRGDREILAIVSGSLELAEKLFKLNSRGAPGGDPEQVVVNGGSKGGALKGEK